MSPEVLQDILLNSLLLLAAAWGVRVVIRLIRDLL